MSSIICRIDDKHIPLYRIIWVADVPHFCGADDCLVEGRYEVRIEHDESLWANREERDAALQALEVWGGGPPREDEDWD